MLGYIIYGDGPKRPELGERQIAGAAFTSLRIGEARRPNGPLALSRAAKGAAQLRESGVRRGVFPIDFPYTALFIRQGITPVETLPLRRALAGPLTRRRMEEWGADILKLAVMPKSAEDLLSLLRVCLTAHRQASRPVVAISMGEIGLESRVCGEAFGSAMTFGCLDQASAPGQLAAGELARLLDALHAAHGKTSPFRAENERK